MNFAAKKLALSFLPIAFCLSQSIYANFLSPLNMAYVEVNDHKLTNAGCYIKTSNNKPFFDMISVFAANINGTDSNNPIIYFNPQVDALLNKTSQVTELQKKGIKVLLTLLGNHQNAGWSCMTDSEAINKFANDVVKLTNQYKLDGIDIDDEYSTCMSNTTSMLRIARAIKENPAFNGKLLTKALYADESYFTAYYKGSRLADFLDYGWEMTYDSPNFDSRLLKYVTYGLHKENIYLGISVDKNYHYANAAASYIMQQNFGGVMSYNVSHDSLDYLNILAKVEENTKLLISPDCLEMNS